MDHDLLSGVDHLVYATPDVDASVAELQKCLGVRATPGGQHPGRGTRNALIALSETCYLEIVGPDATQPRPDAPRWFGIDTLATPRLVTWAVRSADLDSLVADAARQGVRLGPLASGSRQATDGTLVRWRFTDPATMVADGLVPFFIDWGSSPHPARSAPGGPALLSLRGRHPDPHAVIRMLAAVGVALAVESGPAPALVAVLSTQRGEVELT